MLQQHLTWHILKMTYFLFLREWRFTSFPQYGYGIIASVQNASVNTPKQDLYS